MLNLKIISSILLFILNGIHPHSAIRLGACFKEKLITPNAVENAPQRRMHVSYNKNITVVKTGGAYDRPQIIEEPFILWQCRVESTYTIIMTCLDEILDNKTKVEKQSHWWLVSNIRNCSVKDGEQIFPYQLNNRLPVGGFQRVVILAFSQIKYLDKNVFPNVTGTSEESRESFTIKQFVKAHMLGDALAGNFFYLAF